MATRAEQFKSEQERVAARNHKVALPASGVVAPAAKSARPRKAKDGNHIKSATALTSREKLIDNSPTVRHERRT